MKFEGEFGEESVSQELISVGDARFVRQEPAGEWESIDSSIPMQPVTLNPLLELTNVGDPSFVDQDGMNAYWISGTPSEEFSIQPPGGGADGEAQTTLAVLIDAESYLPLGAEWTYSYDSAPCAVRWQFDLFNAVPAIEHPSTS